MLSRKEKDIYKDWTMLDYELYSSIVGNERKLNEKARQKLEEIRKYIESKEIIKNE